MNKGEFLAYNTYSGWNNKRIMQKYFIPYFTQHSARESLLILDNHGSHVADVVTNEFEKSNINCLHLAPNTTAITQPVDVEIGATIKGRIKGYFEEWIVDSWDNKKDFFKYNEKKKKYTYQAPTKELIVGWILRAYEETSKRTIINGNYLLIFFNKILGFEKAGVFEKNQQKKNVNEKVNDLYIVHDIEEFVHIEKAFFFCLSIY